MMPPKMNENRVENERVRDPLVHALKGADQPKGGACVQKKDKTAL